MDTHYKHCLITPFLNRFDMVAQLLEKLMQDLPPATVVILIDDGSDEVAKDSPTLKNWSQDERVVFLRHETNLGPAAARNSGVAWCRQRGINTVILLDSDCIPQPGMVQKHLELQDKHPDMMLIGGGIQGEGKGIWAHVDRTLSWFILIPQQPEKEINEPLHLPTTNLSFRLENFTNIPQLFEPRYRTGEDIAFVKLVRKMGGKLFFSPQPIIHHQDRESFKALFSHQFRWALHTYIVRTGIDNSSIFRQISFLLFFLMTFPIYVFYATYLTITPWIKIKPLFVLYIPVILLAYTIKGFGVIMGTINPKLALYEQ
ncbi:MAG: glycosyltransferase [Magnetococcales bacterium]|nr:glycosyltransferase [Magnetococcales bacterium]